MAQDVGSVLRAGMAAHHAGKLEEAERLYREVLRVAPESGDAWHLLGAAGLQRGQARRAVGEIGRAVAVSPRVAQYRFTLGQAHWALGEASEALAAFESVAALEPAQVEAHVMRGAALTALQRHAEAVAALEQAERLRPGDADLPSHVGAALIAGGRYAEAVEAGMRALGLNPTHAGGLVNTAAALRLMGELERSEALFERATAAHPGLVEAWHGWGVVLGMQEKTTEAMEALRRAMALAPHRVEPRMELARQLMGAQREEEALAVLQPLLQPGAGGAGAEGEARAMSAALLQRLGRMREAVEAARRAAALLPGVAQVQFDLGVLEGLMRGQEAGIRHYQAALRADANHAGALANLGDALRSVGRQAEGLAYTRRAVEAAPGESRVHSSLLYALHFCEGISAEELLAEHGRWAQRHVMPLLAKARPHENRREAGRRLRVGYVSPDLYAHVIARNLLPLLAAHDREQVEVYGYSSTARPDAWTARCEAACDAWRSVAGLGDEALAEAVRADGIDILVDCSLHMSDNRALMFARKPAPVQVAMMGYPSTTGSPAIDWRLSDPALEPIAEAGGNSGTLAGPERVARLGCSWWLYKPDGEEPEVRPRPVAENGYITFGSLNNPSKSSPEAIAQWAAVLQAVPRSRLLLITTPTMDTWVAQRLVDLGVNPERIELLPQMRREEYLAYYHRVDVVVDPWPYTGHSTSVEAMWMGVPVLSRAGELPTSRAGASLAWALGLPEMAARSGMELVSRAAGWAAEVDRVVKLSGELRERMRASVLMDAAGYAAEVERVFREAWGAYCAGSCAER